jgi:signal transduction histidine kinase
MQPLNHAQMIKPDVTFFSNENQNLSYLICEVHKYYGAAINQTIFREESTFIDSIKSFSIARNESQLFVIDVDNSNASTINFIASINKYMPYAVKLIFAEKNHLDVIQRSTEKNDSILFLNKPFDSDEIKLSLEKARQIFSQIKAEDKTVGTELSFEENVQEKVNQKLQILIDANLAKDSFLSIIAHDLKSPFVALQGISEILLNDWDSLSEKTKLELIGDLHKTSEDTYKMLETLLEWSKLQKEKLEVNIKEVSIHQVVASTLRVSENNASVKGIKITNEIDNNIKVHTDENMIATVFRNLISNAVQYTQPGGKINITAKEEKDFCTFCIADNGSGIDKPHILEFFNRSNRKKLNGNASAFKGLGLIICKDFVEKNGGQIWLETKKGFGSKFFFTVPC